MNENLIHIPEENIQMSFYIENQEYIVLSEIPELYEGASIYFAKRDHLDEETNVIRNIESDEEYNLVLAKYEELLKSMEDEYEESDY